MIEANGTIRASGVVYNSIQTLCGAENTAITARPAKYLNISGNGVNSANPYFGIPLAKGGTLTNFIFYCRTPGEGTNIAATICVSTNAISDMADTALTCNFTATTATSKQSASDTTHSVAILDGACVGVKILTDAALTTSHSLAWSVQLIQ